MIPPTGSDLTFGRIPGIFSSTAAENNGGSREVPEDVFDRARLSSSHNNAAGRVAIGNITLARTADQLLSCIIRCAKYNSALTRYN